MLSAAGEGDVAGDAEGLDDGVGLSLELGETVGLGKRDTRYDEIGLGVDLDAEDGAWLSGGGAATVSESETGGLKGSCASPDPARLGDDLIIGAGLGLGDALSDGLDITGRVAAACDSAACFNAD